MTMLLLPICIIMELHYIRYKMSHVYVYHTIGSPGLTQPITTRLSMDVGYMKDIDHMNASGKNPMNDGL